MSAAVADGYAIPLNGKNRGYINAEGEPQPRFIGSPAQGLVIHGNGVPRQAPQAIVDYWLANTDTSAHDIVSWKGNRLPCIPWYEQAHAGGAREYTDLGTELVPTKGGHPREWFHHVETVIAHEDWSWTNETWEETKRLAIDICQAFNYNPRTQLWLHAHFVGVDHWPKGHRCIERFIERPDEWELFKLEVSRG